MIKEESGIDFDTVEVRSVVRDSVALEKRDPVAGDDERVIDLVTVVDRDGDTSGVDGNVRISQRGDEILIPRQFPGGDGFRPIAADPIVDLGSVVGCAQAERTVVMSSGKRNRVRGHKCRGSSHSQA
jgi:hypothetical protein